MGVSASTPDHMVLDAGVLSIGGVVIGATRGGAVFNSNPNFRDPEIDNQPNPTAGTKRVLGYSPTLTVTGLEFTSALMDAAIAGGAATPAAYVVALASYETAVYVATKGDGSSVTITLNNALCVNPGLTFQNENEGEASLELVGHYTLGDRTPPFSVAVS